MTQRMWKWAGSLTAVALVVLAFSIRARATWHAPLNSPNAAITLNQLMGFVVSVLMLVAASLIALTGYRRHRENVRPKRWRGFDDDTIDFDTTGIREHQGHEHHRR